MNEEQEMCEAIENVSCSNEPTSETLEAGEIKEAQEAPTSTAEVPQAMD